MNARPNPGRLTVGGASPDPWEALTEITAATTRQIAGAAASDPAQAVAAGAAWYTNMLVDRMVATLYACAKLARDQGEAIVAGTERALPDGPVRRAMTAAGSLQFDLATAAAEAVL